MKKKTNRKNKKRLHPIGFLVLCFVIMTLTSSIIHLWKLNSQVNIRLAELNKQKAILTQQQKELKNEIVQLNVPSYIEQLARDQLGLVRPGEILIRSKK